MPMQITSGPAHVLAAGDVTTFAGHGLVLRLDLDGVDVAVELEFQSDPSIEDVMVGTEEIPGGYRIRCVNFDGPDGRGSSVPVLVGSIGSDGIFLHFRVFRWGRTDDRTVHYSFYRVPGAITGVNE